MANKRHPYDTILQRLQTRYDSINYDELRKAYTRTPEYSPYNDRSVTMYRDKMIAALNQKDSAISYAESALNINFLNIEAHMVVHEARLALDDREEAIKHRHIADSLLNSVLNSGDGQTAKTAYRVISVQEEYAVICALGGRTVKQVLVNDGEGRFYDVHEIVRPGLDDKEQIFFDVSMPYETLSSGRDDKKSRARHKSRVKSFIKGIFCR